MIAEDLRHGDTGYSVEEATTVMDFIGIIVF